ncbi:MAG TPA: trehalose-phosphatase, partial [Chitinophagaceae bacterium]|nr:trehalose-phosphatase [Chitinophagaceae bacterium]
DYTKGLNYRLDGYEAFLENNPEWREKVTFILNVIPSRDNIPAYIERKKTIEEKVSTINGKYSTLQWQPLIYRFNHLEFDELCALYQAADVALLTPLRDGMNLVAKEFIASCIDKGVLILSELTGAANELNEALLVNPTDTEEVATAIVKALNMPLTEQRSRLAYMQKRLSDYNVVRWVNDFLEQLNAAKLEQQANAINLLDKQSIKLIIDDFTHSKKRCILLDYDGTLSPIQKLPSMALPGEDILNLLTELSKDKANEVVVISGRDSNILEKWLGNIGITLIAEHGAMTRYKGEEWQQQTTASNEWKSQIKPIMQLFVSRCAGSFIEEKKNTLAWHYRNTHPDLGFIRSRELQNSLLQLTLNTPLQVVDGNKVLEVRVIGMDKGVTATNLLKHFNPEFTICLGDDTTDEDMFKVLRDKAYTIKIGSGNTAAQYTLPSQQDVLPLLKKFITPVRKEEYGYTQI